MLRHHRHHQNQHQAPPVQLTDYRRRRSSANGHEAWSLTVAATLAAFTRCHRPSAVVRCFNVSLTASKTQHCRNKWNMVAGS